MTEIWSHSMWTDSVAIYPEAGKGSTAALSYVGLKLCGEAGEVAEHIGKAMRDDGGVITDERKEKLIKEVGDVYWYLARMCRELGVDPRRVLEANVEKLEDRKKREKIKGSGDDR